MVFSDEAREDAEKEFFSGDKIALYHQSVETEDLTYGSVKTSYTTYRLKVQGGILGWSDRLVKAGKLQEGDAAGVFRYEYTEDADGNSITPTLIPKEEDEITLLQRRFRLTKVSPAMSEDHNIILFTFEGKPSTNQQDLYFPLEFPIQF